MKRRQLLSALGLGSVAGLGGCLAHFDDVALSGVDVVNMDAERRSVEVRVSRNGEVVHESAHDLPANEGTTLDCTWATETGQFVLAGRFEGDDEWQERDVADVEADCAFGIVAVHHSGEVVQVLLSDRCDLHERC